MASYAHTHSGAFMRFGPEELALSASAAAGSDYYILFSTKVVSGISSPENIQLQMLSKNIRSKISEFNDIYLFFFEIILEVK